MPIKRSALRQLRKDRTRGLRNRIIRSELKTLKKQLASLLTERKHADLQKLLPAAMRQFDQAASKGIIHKNTASRAKSRLMRRLVKSSPPSSTN